MPKLPFVALVLAGGLLCGSDFARAQPATDALGDPLPRGALLRMGTARFHAPSSVVDMVLTPDGTTLITIGNELIAWETATGKVRWRAATAEHAYRPVASGYGIRALAMSDDGSHFLTPGLGNRPVLWETSTGRHENLEVTSRISPANIPDNTAKWVDITRDGKRLALGTAIGAVVCDRRGNVLDEIMRAAPGPERLNQDDRLAFVGHYSFGGFSPDGKMLSVVTCDRPDEVRLHDAENGRHIRALTLASRLVRLAFSPDGRRLATTERDAAVRLYDVATGKRVWSHVVQLSDPFENYTSAVAFSPDGKVIAAGATDHLIYLLDSATGEETGRLSGHHWYPWALAFTADSKTLYSAGWDGAIRRWDLATRTQLDLPAGVRGSAVVGAAADGRTLAYMDDSGRIRLLDADGTERRSLALPGVRFSQVSFSPDGTQLAGGGHSGDQVHVAVWDASTGRALHRWDWPKGKDPHSAVEALEFTPDGSRLAAAVFRQSAGYLWDLTTGREVARIPHRQVYGLSFTPDGRSLVTAGWDSNVRFSDAATGTIRRTVKAADPSLDDSRMYTVSCAQEGGLIATAHLDGSVIIWQADSMEPCTRFRLKGRFIFGAMRFSPDGLWLATGSATGDVQIMDPATGEVVWDLGRHQHYAYTLAFWRGAQALVSGGSEGVSYLWDLRPPPRQTALEPDRLWHDLVGENSPDAYHAMWALVDTPERTVPMLAERIASANLVVDLTRLAAGKSDEDQQRLRRIRALMAKPDSKVVLSVGLRRAVSVLERIGNAEAIGVLKTLAESDPRDEVKQSATAALRRLRGVERP